MYRIAGRIIDILVFPAVLIALGLAFLYAPPDATMHEVYRIFYFHVPAAAAAFLSFGLVFICSVLYLRTRRQRYDIVAAAAGEVGVLFCGLGIVMGMLWAKPVWGVFWIPGDIHLVATAILFLIYVAYVMIRAAVEDEEKRARLAAIVGVFGVIGVPVVFFSIRVIHVGNHPVLLSLADPRMRLTFMFCMATMILFYTAILLRRIRLGRTRAETERLRVAIRERRGDSTPKRIVAGAPVHGASPETIDSIPIASRVQGGTTA